MQRRPLFAFLFWLFFATNVASCNKDPEPAHSGLVGTWKLISRSCECEPEPVLGERVTFTGTTFTFHKDSQFTANGTYALAPFSRFCSPVPGLRFTATSGNLTAQEAAYTLSDNRLVLDYGGACIADALVATYERLP